MQVIIDIIEFLGAYKDLGIAGVALIIMALYGKWMATQAFSQVKEANRQTTEANKRAEDTQKEFREFLQNEYKHNQETMSDLVSSFERHVASKDEAMSFLKDMVEDRYRRAIIFSDRNREELEKENRDKFNKFEKENRDKFNKFEKE